MTVREATLLEVLENREQRVLRQRRLLGEYQKTLICFTMNIPGPIKNNGLIRSGYELGKRQLQDILAGSRIPVVHQEEACAVTGCEGFFLVDAAPERVKKLTVRLEDGSEFGRLLDLDVLDAEGKKLSREAMGLPGRLCLLCGKPASVCGPIRAHSAGELWQRAEQLLQSAVTEDRAAHIGAMAAKALLYEVCVTPKPGLVDRDNSGAHRDMDIFTFLGSTAVLQPYFTQCAAIGMETRELPPVETFGRIRLAGMLAEQIMFRETGGINTHKGAVFSLGLACAGAGRLGGECPMNPADLLARCAAMTEGITRQDFANVTRGNAVTAGERLYAEYGITGIRGQAERGFPAVLETGLPVLEKGLAKGMDMDQTGAAALLAILAATDDTNLIARSDRKTQQQTAREIARLLEENPYPGKDTLTRLDQTFTARNLSPGGSADLLALTLFVHFLSR